MHVSNSEQVELAAYQLKNKAKTGFDQWKEGRDKDAPHPSWPHFKEAFLGHFFPQKLKEAKLSLYDPEVVKDMRSRIHLFVASLDRASRKEGRVAMLTGDMDISKLMVYVQQVEEEKLSDIEEYRNKKAKTGNESRQQKSNATRSSLQQKQMGNAPSSASAPTLKKKFAPPDKAAPKELLPMLAEEQSACMLSIIAKSMRTHHMLSLRQLKVNEKNFPTHDVELVALVFSLKIWRHYLYCIHVDVFTDLKRLQYVFTQREFNLIQRRLLDLLKDYDMSILYHPVKVNVFVDALSRLSMGTTAHLKEDKKEAAKEVSRLARLGD
ncbi:uncharacterized protein LOC107017134 [Solanum pennellii]|uniref:Uncharacterized protein LOC107017134 n=1 Tax=Solanum pennellii TaxID=28526 RepID=A0ABM1GLJ6_SOLPN|nr:uncharacterized protein LOC107017134 [Solanum pennellii]